jgi:hypothetical protein
MARIVNSDNTTTEHSCGLDNPEVGGDLIAHEFGHYLNLADSNCTYAIMGSGKLIQSGGQLIRNGQQSVLGSECSMADQLSFTPSEQEERECVSDPEPCTGTSPILIDLDRNSFHLAAGPVMFDIDADGELESLAWTAPEQKDAFLCFDRNGNGMIDDGSELFGDSTLMAAGHRAAHGYLALAEFDESFGGNFDGRITSADMLYEDLCLWLDRNHNGISEPEELQGLAEAGVVSIGLDFRVLRRQDAMGNLFPYVGSAWIVVDGKAKKTSTTDVTFIAYE